MTPLGVGRLIMTTVHQKDGCAQIGMDSIGEQKLKNISHRHLNHLQCGVVKTESTLQYFVSSATGNVFSNQLNLQCSGCFLYCVYCNTALSHII